MAIIKYTGQPLEPGMLVCREGILTGGFGTIAVRVAKLHKTMVTIEPVDGVGRRRTVALRSLTFIVDTVEEGERVANASVDHITEEAVISKQQAKERHARRTAAIEALLAGSTT